MGRTLTRTGAKYIILKIDIQKLRLQPELPLNTVDKRGLIAMCKENQEIQNQNEEEMSETWAADAVQELLDFWEEQGVYIRE